MPNQAIVTAIDHHGRHLCMNRTSRGAQLAGIQTSQILGHQMWDFTTDPSEKEMIRHNLAKCLFDNAPQQYVTASKLGAREVWDCLLMPCDGAAVVVYAREIAPPDATLTEDDLVIIRLLASDKTLQEVAESLGVKENTVATQCRRLREKVGVNTNHGLIAWASRFDLFD